MMPTPEKRFEPQDPPKFTIRRIMRRYYTMWWVYSFANGFLYGVYPLFLRSRGLNQFQINSVLATFFVVIFLTDVPTGAFADALGRRRSFVIGCAHRVAAFLLYFSAHHYAVFLMAEMIDGVGTTFCNGAIDAWGVDALDKAGFNGLKDRLFSRISQLTSMGFMAAALIGGYVADVNIAWPWLLGATGFFASAIVAMSLMQEHGTHGPRVEIEKIPAQVTERVVGGLRRGFASRPVMLLSLANAVSVAAWAPYWIQWPQYFNDTYGVGIWIIGWVYCLFTSARIAGAEAVVHLSMDEGKRATRLIVLLIFVGVLLFMAGTESHRPNLVLALLFMMNLCTGAMQPLTQSWLNEQISAGERATLLSFNTTFATMGGSMGLLGEGVVADKFGIPVAWQMSGVLTLAAMPCYWMLRTRRATGSVMTEASS
jgi:MFS family permease